MEKCKICSSIGLKVVYQGPIRIGKFGSLSEQPHAIMQCPTCHAKELPNTFGSAGEYYQGEAYRKEVDGEVEASDYFRLHDGEQLRNLSVTGTGMFRNKVIADVGCGAGSFLDGVRGHAARAIAIEPYSTFRTSLAVRGYSCYPYIRDALAEHAEKVDVATSFSVLEHVEDPLDFLKGMRSLLAPGGKAVISTPNADDILLEALPESYPSFFYRKAHLWYFNAEGLTRLLSLAGFPSVKIVFHQRFGLGNFLGWMKEARPQGDTRPSYVSATLDAAWKAELERSGRCDYLYAEATA